MAQNPILNVLARQPSSFESFASGAQVRQGQEFNKLRQAALSQDMSQQTRLNKLADDQRKHQEDLAGAQRILASPRPSETLKQLFPHLYQEGATDEEVLAGAQQVRDQAMMGLGQTEQQGPQLNALQLPGGQTALTYGNSLQVLQPTKQEPSWREKIDYETDAAIRRANATRAPTAQFVPMTPQEVSAAGLPEGTSAQRNSETGQIQVLDKPKAMTSGEDSTQQKLDAANNTLSAIRDVKEKIGWRTTGVGGQVIGKVAGTDAANLAADLDTIKSNIGFDRLQMMREASKTGGALGGIAVRELELLQSTIASLDVRQSPANLMKNIEKVEAQYEKAVEAYRKALGLPEDSGATGTWEVGTTQEVGGFKVTRKR